MFAVLVLCSCEGTSFRSAVPNAPVSIRINTNEWEWVHFKPANIGAIMTVDKQGFHLNGKTYSIRRQDYYGYRGLVVVVDNNGQHSAFDMCCPNCVYQNDGTVEIDGMFARCPHCGEEYDLSWGYANPQKGIAKQCLRKYTCTYSGEILTITNP